MSKASFLWHDYETWGVDPRRWRAAQFAAIRTDLDFNVIGEPINILNQPTDDMLPDPQASLVTGLTPQKVLEEGFPPHEFAARVHKAFMVPGTISNGYNTLRFDDEFTRFTLWRNLYEPYEREYANDNGRWDIIDLVRMARALRPEGILWPQLDGEPVNKLELLTKENNIAHDDAHDALSDVRATIQLAKLIRTKQPKLYNWLFGLRTKAATKDFLQANIGQPIVHTSGKLKNEWLNTTVMVPIVLDPNYSRGYLCLDLRNDPQEYLDLSVEDIAKRVFTSSANLPQGTTRLNMKSILFNRAPALAPLGTLSRERAAVVGLDMKSVSQRAAVAKQNLKELAKKLKAVTAKQEAFSNSSDAEADLYGSFISNSDKKILQKVHQVKADELPLVASKFDDQRLVELCRRFQARNFPNSLTDEERSSWEEWRAEWLHKSGPYTFTQFGEDLKKALAENPDNYTLQELQLWAESIYVDA